MPINSCSWFCSASSAVRVCFYLSAPNTFLTISLEAPRGFCRTPFPLAHHDVEAVEGLFRDIAFDRGLVFLMSPARSPVRERVCTAARAPTRSVAFLTIGRSAWRARFRSCA